jgi:hypothetical protein
MPMKKVTRRSAKSATRRPAPRRAATGNGGGESASRRIDARIRELGDWRGKTLARVRRLILASGPEIVEEWKWGVPVWSSHGILCTGETYRSTVKLTFARGASLDDPSGLFNSSLGGNTRRAIDIHADDEIDAAALQDLVRAAAALNLAGSSRPRSGGRRSPVLLSGGNPQIAKAEGDAPVQAWIAAIPGWRRDVARRLDRLVERTVPDVRKAVKWNSPFYGIAGRGWFASFHVYARYVKVTFFKGTSLRPAPEGGRSKEARWIDVHERDLDEAQMAKWMKQAAALPGWGGS